MTSKVFTSGTTIDSAWLNDVNDSTYVTVPALATNVGNSLLKANNLSDVVSATTARTNLGAATAGANSDITSLTGLTTPLSVEQGGTGSSIAGSIQQIQSITASVVPNPNALTISTGALSLNFRSTTLDSGAVSTVQGTPTALVIPSGATLGTVAGQLSRVIVLAINNAGTIELAAVNSLGGLDLTEAGLLSTTVMSTSSDLATVAYSTTARTSLAYRVIGYVESTQATPGTWVTTPSTVQGQGGQALSAMSSIGYGSWQTVTRVAGTTYYNTKPYPIACVYRMQAPASQVAGLFTVNGLGLPSSLINPSEYMAIHTIVPPGGSYSATAGGGSIAAAAELR